LLFFKLFDQFRQRWPELELVERRRLALLAYPLSGGWRRPTVLPAALLPLTVAIEGLLTPLAPLLAFRCRVVLRRR
jgi:hypothetical protein